MENAVAVAKPEEVSVRLCPFSAMPVPWLSVAHAPVSEAVVGSSPLSVKVVRKVRVTLTGVALALCHTQRYPVVSASQPLDGGLTTMALCAGERMP